MRTLTNTLKKEILSLAEEGLSTREVVAELKKRGQSVGKTSVATVIATGSPEMKATEGADAEAERQDEPPPGDDLALLDRFIAETRIEARKLRKRGDHRGYAVMARVASELLAQRVALRPPPKIDPDLDPENIRIQQELFAEMDRMAEDFDKERDAEWDALVAEAREHGCPPFIADRIRRRLTWFFDGGVLEPFPPPGIVTSGTPTPELVANYDDEPNGGTPKPSNDDSETEEDGEEEPYRPRSMIETRRKGEVGPVTLNKPAGWKREEDMDNWLIPFEGGLGPRDRFP